MKGGGVCERKKISERRGKGGGKEVEKKLE